MIKKQVRNVARKSRHKRVRAKISGTSSVPRLNVFRSNKNISVQVIDDVNGVTLVSVSSMDKDLNITNGGNVEAATFVGKTIAEKCLAAKIDTVVFDRGGNIYHGRVKAVAEAAREAGLKF